MSMSFKRRFGRLSYVGLVYCLFFSNTVKAEFANTIQQIKSSIVAVGTYQQTRSPSFIFRGTGFVVGNGLLIATNGHVLPNKLDQEQREKLTVMVRDGSNQSLAMRDAQLVALDRQHDIALLKIGGEPLSPMSIGDSDRVREGNQYLFTGFPIGSALGLFPVSHRAMIASVTPVALPSANAKQLDPRVIQRLKDGSFQVFQLDATAYPGNSGSPLFDTEVGSVIGIVNMVFVKGTKEAVLSEPSGISFAIPAKYLAELLKSVK